MSDTATPHGTELTRGAQVEVRVERMAHGGEGIALVDGRVVFVKGGFPGDRLLVEVNKAKKSFARASIIEVIEPSPLRGEHRCQAAASGGGCCDFSALKADHEAELKKGVLVDQLQRLGGLSQIPDISVHDLEPHSQWRTRVRLGVSSDGDAGVRIAASNRIIANVECSQAPSDIYAGVLGKQARKFTPGSEVVAAIDDEGVHHVVEIKKAPRGSRAESITKVHSGSGVAVQQLEGVRFELPATAFWQAHEKAAQSYSSLIREWISTFYNRGEATSSAPVGWDLYGGVGAFVPAIRGALGEGAIVHSVEASPKAAQSGEMALDCAQGGSNENLINFHSATVEKVIDQLPHPDVVVLDPPRTGAGQEVIEKIVAAAPRLVIHIGCDPATFARDTRTWSDSGYQLHKVALFNAFPGTHHMETIGLFLPLD